MQNRILLFAAVLLVAGACAPPAPETTPLAEGQLRIEWADSIAGDFSFREKWDYPEGIYINEHGQLSCDGFCPPETDRMKDEHSRIYPDSLAAFYRLVDTTHLYHTISCEAVCYEWAGTDYIQATRKGDTITCATQCNAGTHCSLQLALAGDVCTPRIELNSIIAGNSASYSCSGGSIRVDKKLFAQGVLRASFDLRFSNPEKPGEPFSWKGLIYKKID